MSHDWEHVPSDRHVAASRISAESATLAALPNSHHRWTRKVSVVAVAGGAALALTGTAAYVAFAPVEDTSMIECYSDDTAAGNGTWASMANGVSSASPPTSASTAGPPQIGDPVGLCGDLWRQGVLVAGVHNAQPPTPDANFTVPALVACVADSDGRQIVAVVPGGADVCERLGMPRWQE